MGPFTHDLFPGIRVLSPAASRPIADLGKVFWGIHVLACSPDGKWLAGMSSLDANHRRLHVWNVAGRQRVRWLEGHGDKPPR
jgi:hypothetical protein